MQTNEDFGSIETSKWVERLYSPIDGFVSEINDKVTNQPELVNNSPFIEGWLVKIELQGNAGAEALMSPKEYLEYIKACEEGN